MSYLKNFWELVSFKKLPQTIEDIHVLVQAEMIKFHNRAVICKIPKTDTEKYTFVSFVREGDKKYFCTTSKMLVKCTSEVRHVIDMILDVGLIWGIETNLEDSFYLVASWKHWGESINTK